ncbi:uncharacterized protein V1510DRAFT_389460 [Dipodascopsis tothii]|uniref:uncharacterized protein n=1 Tax=Dipodascopsis tothii TaxID=44089 RepID=UPI0034CD0563
MADDNRTSTILGIVGTILWCIQLVPQIVVDFRRKSTKGVPQSMMLLWTAAGAAFSVYFCVPNSNMPLMIQPQIFTALCLVAWLQCLYYADGLDDPRRMPLWKALACVAAVVAVSAGVQAALIVPLKDQYHNHDVRWPNLLIGTIAALLIILGFVPPFKDMVAHGGEVVGLNFVFLAIDSAGALFSMASLLTEPGAFQSPGVDLGNDIIGIVLYLMVPVCEVGMIAGHTYWWLRGGRRAASVGEPLDAAEKGVRSSAETVRADESDSSLAESGALAGPETGTETGTETEVEDAPSEKKALE